MRKACVFLVYVFLVAVADELGRWESQHQVPTRGKQCCDAQSHFMCTMDNAQNPGELIQIDHVCREVSRCF